jgi:uncharacterized protein related to proFAR isomerase
MKKTSIITGGGVRNFDDLKTLYEKNIDGVLIATALHKGNIGKKEINKFQVKEHF